jgi:hypothetical protein
MRLRSDAAGVLLPPPSFVPLGVRAAMACSYTIAAPLANAAILFGGLVT